MGIRTHLLVTVLFGAILGGFCAPTTGAQTHAGSEGIEQIAVLPFEQKGLSPEETVALTKYCTELLQSAGRFEVMPYDEMLRLLVEADFNLETCTYSYCLADAGKVLGVQRVMHGSVTRRGKLYTLRLRFINVRNAEILSDRKSEYSGEFERLLSDVLPAEAQAASDYSVESAAPWYVPAAAIAVTVGIIYWIYRSFNKTAESESTDGGPSLPQ